MSPEEPNALALMAAARSGLESGVTLDADLAPFIERLREVQTLTADLAADVAQYAAAIDMDPQRLQEVHQRRAAITQLLKAYGPELDDVLTWREQAGREAQELAGSDDRIAAIDAEIAGLTPKVGVDALALHDLRRSAAERLGEAVTQELHHLSLIHI